MQNYDIIGDVHGCASLLEERLIDLGYRRREGTGAYRHEDHDSYQAIYVGDLIDRATLLAHRLAGIVAVDVIDGPAMLALIFC